MAIGANRLEGATNVFYNYHTISMACYLLSLLCATAYVKIFMSFILFNLQNTWMK